MFWRHAIYQVQYPSQQCLQYDTVSLSSRALLFFRDNGHLYTNWPYSSLHFIYLNCFVGDWRAFLPLEPLTLGGTKPYLLRKEEHACCL